MSVAPITGARGGRAGDVGIPGSQLQVARVEISPSPFVPLAIAIDHCKGCGLCVTACPPGVLALEPQAVNRLGYHPVRLVDPAGCTSCVRCARVCPDAVFTIWARPREA
jgi:2-oxoglutarate ferredoxin oxidoreductase subunit delta